MKAIFRGQFEAKIDAKSRLALPAPFREGSDSSIQLVITNSIFRNKKCLDVYSWQEWLKLEERIARLPSLNADVQAFQRFYMSAGQIVSEDANHRILIPKTLKAYAGLSSEIQILGMGTKFEIWDRKVWLSLNTDLIKSFEQIQAGVANLEKGEGE